jgi:hypothetical protein
MNKYFKGRAPALKIYFKMEEVEEAVFYHQQKTVKVKDSESSGTADDDVLTVLTADMID